SYKSSHRNIESELKRIILANNCLNQIVSYAKNDNKLFDSLKILKKRKLSSSIDISDEFESQDLF
ncbi:1034_t:CDS:1, partial [Cetraspora pellucida]